MTMCGVKWAKIYSVIAYWNTNWIKWSKTTSPWSLTDHLSGVTVRNIYESFTHKMAAKTSWHRYGTKLRHCQPMYLARLTPSVINWRPSSVELSWHSRSCDGRRLGQFITLSVHRRAQRHVREGEPERACGAGPSAFCISWYFMQAGCSSWRPGPDLSVWRPWAGSLIIRGPTPPSNAIIYMHLQL